MDISLQHPSGDRLERQFFANSLASQIWEMCGLAEGYVIGIEAEWGAGKSSVVNLALLRLLHLEMEQRSHDIAFYGDIAAPMNLETLEALCLDFDVATGFSEPDFGSPYVHPDHYNRAVVDRTGGDKDRQRQLYRYLRLRWNSKADPKNLVVHFRPWLIPDTAALSTVFIEELSKSVGSMLGVEVEQALKGYSDLIGKIAPAAGLAAQAVVPGAGIVVRDFLSALSKKPESTLEERKRKLEASLRKLPGRKIIVVIDDLDRLSPKESVEMVGLVKSLGNLPNVVYLLSYDPKVLTSHIDNILKVPGEQYLEKIVQYRRKLPLIPSDRLLALLDDAFKEIFDNATEEMLGRLRDVMFHAGGRYIQTPRDAIRCSSWALTAHRRLKEQTDPVDLLLMEILNAKDPALYSFIRKEIDLLCDEERGNSAEIERSMKEFPIEANENRIRALAQLFPAAASAFVRPHNTSSGNRTAKRLHRREYASYYFELSEPFTTFGKEALQRLLAAVEPAPILRELIDRSFVSNYGRSLRSDLLDGLWETFTHRPVTAAWAKAIGQESTRLIKAADLSGPEFLARDNLERLAKIIVNGTEHVSVEEQSAVILTLLESCLDLSLPARVFRRVAGGPSPVIEILSRLNAAASADEILTAAAPRDIVLMWLDLDETAAKDHLNAAIKGKRHFAAIADSLLREVNASDEGRYYELWQRAPLYLDIFEIEQWASDLQKGGDPTAAVWAARYLDACRRYRETRDNSVVPLRQM